MSRLRVGLVATLILSIVACDSQQEILNGLSETDANEISVVLQGQQIDATRTLVPGSAGKAASYTMGVKSSQAPQALKIIVDNKLPRTKSDGLSVVYPAGGGGLIPTSREEKARFIMAMQGEIENMLKVLPGFVQAKVVIVLPDNDIIRDANSPPPQATASVAIVYNPIDDKSTPSVTPDDVKYLVASAVQDLAAASVTVIMASNVPMKLVDIGTNKTHPALTSKNSPNTHQASITPAGTTKPAPEEEKIPLVTWLFAVLALAGLAVGVLGQLRSSRLKLKTPKAIPAAEPTKPEEG